MLKTVAQFSYPHEAHIAKALLVSEEIPAFIADEYTINMQWLYSDAIGGVKVQVPEIFVEKAKHLLSTDFSDSVIAEQGIEVLKCPHCGSENVDFLVKGKKIASLVFLALHFPFWPFKKIIICNDCHESNSYKT